MPELYPVSVLEELEVPRAEVNALASLLGVEPRKLDAGITPGMLMLILVYHVLKGNMHQTQAIFVVKSFTKPLLELVNMIQKADAGEGKKPWVGLVVADGRYVFMPNSDVSDGLMIIDLAEMAQTQEIPSPVLTLTIALTELFARASGILAEPQDEQTEVEAAPAKQQAALIAPQQTPQS